MAVHLQERLCENSGQCVVVLTIGASTHCRETRAIPISAKQPANWGQLMFGKSDKSNRHGTQRAKARSKKEVRSPEGRKASADRHEKKVTKRGKIDAQRVRTAERHGLFDLNDVRVNGLDIA